MPQVIWRIQTGSLFRRHPSSWLLVRALLRVALSTESCC